eukprot:7387444-Prymnesium_polylepis.1
MSLLVPVEQKETCVTVGEPDGSDVDVTRVAQLHHRGWLLTVPVNRLTHGAGGPMDDRVHQVVSQTTTWSWTRFWAYNAQGRDEIAHLHDRGVWPKDVHLPVCGQVNKYDALMRIPFSEVRRGGDQSVPC